MVSNDRLTALVIEAQRDIREGLRVLIDGTPWLPLCRRIRQYGRRAHARDWRSTAGYEDDDRIF